MKKLIKIFSLIALTITYSYAVGAIYNTLILSDVKSNLTYKQAEYFSSVSNNLLNNIFNTENSVNNNTNEPAQLLKINFVEFSIILFTKEHILVSKLSQYKFFSENLIINYRKKDIIFPFHYFW